jgi:hypothetical protein
MPVFGVPETAKLGLPNAAILGTLFPYVFPVWMAIPEVAII